MNTAARMESNSLPYVIQVSQSTADELISKGKESWLEARKEKINAKGKGMLQTYFVNPSHSHAATSTMSVTSESIRSSLVK